MLSPLISYALQHFNVYETPTFYLLFSYTFLGWDDFYFSCAFQVLLSWIICWLLVTRHWVLTQHLDHWGCFRNRGERERWPNQGHLLLDVLKLWNSERICTRLVSPRTFSFCTHIHTSFQNPAWMTATVSGPQKNFYLNNEEKVKETISDLLTVTNPTELLKGIWMWKVQQEQNFLKTE